MARYATIGYPIELVNASGFLEALGIAQITTFVLDDERINKYVLTHGHHWGSGLHMAL